MGIKLWEVWIRGSDLATVEGETEREARERIREYYGWKRLPKGTFVCPAPDFEKIVELNAKAGFNATNL